MMSAGQKPEESGATGLAEVSSWTPGQDLTSSILATHVGESDCDPSSCDLKSEDVQTAMAATLPADIGHLFDVRLEDVSGTRTNT